MEEAVMESPDAFGAWMESEVAASRDLLRGLGLFRE